MARPTYRKHIRHSAFERTSRSKRFREFISEEQTDLTGTGAGAVFTAAAGQDFTQNAHGKAVGDGPFALTTAGTLPLGVSLDTLYWIQAVPTANTFRLTPRKGGPAVTLGNAGTGVHTITKASDEGAVFEYLKQNGPTVLRAATDVDTL